MKQFRLFETAFFFPIICTLFYPISTRKTEGCANDVVSLVTVPPPPYVFQRRVDDISSYHHHGEVLDSSTLLSVEWIIPSRLGCLPCTEKKKNAGNENCSTHEQRTVERSISVGGYQLDALLLKLAVGRAASSPLTFLAND